jgi:hypothetical protein
LEREAKNSRMRAKYVRKHIIGYFDSYSKPHKVFCTLCGFVVAASYDINMAINKQALHNRLAAKQQMIQAFYTFKEKKLLKIVAIQNYFNLCYVQTY